MCWFCRFDIGVIFPSMSPQKSGNTSQPDLTNGTPALRDPKAGPSAGASSVPPLPQDHPSSVAFPGHHPSHTSVPPLEPPSQAPAKTPAVQPMKPAEGGPKDISKLTCHQCSKEFSTKPLLFSHQVRSPDHILWLLLNYPKNRSYVFFWQFLFNLRENRQGFEAKCEGEIIRTEVESMCLSENL